MSLCPSVGMDSKDAQESLESGARCRCSNGRRTLTALLLIQGLLTVACAVFTYKIFFEQEQEQEQTSQDWGISPNGIFMQMTDLDSDSELNFHPLWNHNVDLYNKKSVKLSCSGPYMVYLWACNESHKQSVVNLTMVQGSKEFHLQTLPNGECKEMQSVFMLSEKGEVTVKVREIKETYKLKLFLGLHYMLGAKCFEYPL